MAREKLPEAPAYYDKADQDRTRRLIERALSQPAAAGTIQVSQISPQLTETIIKAGKLVRSASVRTTGTIASGASEVGVIDLLVPSNQLILLKVNKKCWIRFYATQQAADDDATRPRTTDPLAGKGVVGEFIINADWVNVLMRVAPVITLYNGDGPHERLLLESGDQLLAENGGGFVTEISVLQSTTIRYRITNDEGADAVISMDLTLIELETAVT